MSEDLAQAARDNRRGTTWLVATVLMAAACVLVLHPLSTSPGSMIHDPRIAGSGDAGRADVRLHAWVLASGTRTLVGGAEGDFYDANIFYPNPATLTYSEHLLGVQPLFAPIVLATKQLALSLNLWILSTFLLSGLSAWWVTYRWFGSHVAGAIAGVAFAFAPWRIYTLVHVKLLSVQYVPLIAWAAVEGRTRPTLRTWLLLAGSCFLEAASCFYLGYLGFLFAGVLIVCCAAFGSGGHARYLAFAGTALAASAVAMLPLSLAYIDSVRPGFMFSAATASTKTIAQYLYPGFPAAPEIGWGVWWWLPALAAFGFAQGLVSKRHRMLTIGLGGVALLGAWLALGPSGDVLGLHVGWIHEWAAEFVPGWSSFRVWSRFAILTWFAISLLAVFPFVSLGSRFELPRPLRAGLGIALLAALLFSAWRVPIGAEPEPMQVASLEPNSWLSRHGDGDPVVHVPREHGRTDAEYMYLSTLDWSPMVNGYGAYVPPSLEVVDPLIRALPAKPALAAFEALGVARWIVLHTDRLSPEVVGAWDDTMGSALRSAGPTHRIYEMDVAGGSSKLLADDPAQSLLGTSRAPLSAENLRARVTTAYPLLSAQPAQPLWISLNVRNRSDVPWPALGLDPQGLVGLQLELRDAAGDVIRAGQFERLPFDLAPKTNARLRVRLLAPVTPGAYQLVPCVTQFGHDARRCVDRGVSLEVRGETARAAEGGDPTVRPNVLLFTIDTLRADYVGAYGHLGGTTPHIDRIAAGGTLFETAYAPMGTTCPSHATLFTSRHTLAHGVVRNGLALLEEEVTLVERLRDAGYRTAGFVSSFPVTRRFGFAQGFESFDDDFGASGPAKLSFREWGGEAVQGRFDRPAEQTAASALRWLEAAPRDKPWFVWVHLFDPHGPYQPPAEFAPTPLPAGTSAADEKRALYAGEVRYADAALGDIVAAFEAAFGEENLLLAITSDHGEGLLDHGWGSHDRTLFEEELRVPLVFRWPGVIPVGERRQVPAHLLDVAPTLLGYLDIGHAGLDGVDLSTDVALATRPLFLSRPQREAGDGKPPTGLGVRLGPWKLIQPGAQEGEVELYDLDADPRERNDLASQDPTRVKELEGRVAQWAAAQMAARSERDDALSDEERAALRALGYLNDSE